MRAALDASGLAAAAALRAGCSSEGDVADAEMHRVFNCGIGMVLVLAAGDAGRAIERLRAAGETVHRIGAIEQRPDGSPPTIVG